MFNLDWMNASERKLRLAAVMRARRALPPDCKAAVDVAERYADGRASKRDLRSAERHVRRLVSPHQRSARFILSPLFGGPVPSTEERSRVAQVLAAEGCLSHCRAELFCAVTEAHDAVREVFGGFLPFTPPRFDPAWRTAAAVELASRMYAAACFDLMPALAAELEAAGCDNATIIEHCRGAATHARGCWVVDLLIGRE